MTAIDRGKALAILLLIFLAATTRAGDHDSDATDHPKTNASTPLTDQVKHIFNNKCKTCHTYDGADGDLFSVFGADGLPEADKVPQVLDRTSREAGRKGVMPPKDGDPLTDKEKQTIKDWAASLQMPATPSAPSCELVKADNLPARPEGSVSDREAHAILAKACAQCHGGEPPLTLATATFDAYFTVLHPVQGLSANAQFLIRSVHTRFLYGDGEINPYAIAKDTETIGRIYNQVAGVDGRGFMPPHGLPDWFVGHYNDEDRKKLIAWLHEQSSTELPKGCQTFIVPGQLTFDQAEKQCSDKQARLINLDQFQKLQDQLSKELGDPQGCAWTSSVNPDKSNSQVFPHRTWNFEGKSSGPWLADGEAKCYVACIR